MAARVGTRTAARAWLKLTGRRVRLALLRRILAAFGRAPVADAGAGQSDGQVVLGPANARTRASAHPPVGAVVDIGPSTRQGIIMAFGSALGQALKGKAGELAAATAGWEPNGMMEYVGTVDGLEETIRQVATMVEGLHNGAGNLPLEPSAVDAIGMIVRALQAAADTAAQAATTLKMAHADDIKRVTDGRRNEQKWDVTANR
jgi:hypothetical protein